MEADIGIGINISGIGIGIGMNGHTGRRPTLQW